MPTKQGPATKGKITAAEKRFEAAHLRSAQQRQQREVEREGRQKAAGAAPTGKDASGGSR